MSRYKLSNEALIQKWWDNSTTIPFSGCWIYLGALSKRGRTKIYRPAYEILVGKVPAGLELDHKCNVKSCWNPQHLEPVTHSVNLLRRPPSKSVKQYAHGVWNKPIIPIEIKSGEYPFMRRFVDDNGKL
jgi:hypothetical protein